MQQSEGISIPVRREYNFAQRLFCVPALRTCTHTQSIQLTKQQRNLRKKIMLNRQHLSSQFSIDYQNEPLAKLTQLSTIGLLQQLYSNQSWEYKNLIFSVLKTKRLNPIFKKNIERDDLEYYIPQLLTYLVFQHDLCDFELIQFIIRSCEIYFVYSHYCYFYLNSISKIDGVEIPEVSHFVQETFLPSMMIYKDHLLTGLEVIRKDQNIKIEKIDPREIERDAALKYGTIEQDQIKVDLIASVELNRFSEDGYLSTPKFWEQLIDIGNNLWKSTPKIVGLRKQLREINKKLPADVYIPFLKYRNYVVLNINIETAKVFSTKQRAPYSICLEIFKEEEEYIKDDFDIKLLYKKMSKQITVEKNENCLKLPICNSKSMRDDEFRQSVSKTKTLIEMSNKLHILQGIKIYNNNLEKQNAKIKQKTKEKQQILNKNEMKQFFEDDTETKNPNDGENSKFQEKGQLSPQQQILDPEQQYDNLDQLDKTSIHTQTSQDNQNQTKPADKYFDVSFEGIQNNIRSKSIYKNFKSWKLVNIMIKTGDNLKQQQFAMQMINQFNIIFQKQQTELLLRPYEVISITHDSGIMQMVTDSCSLGRIIKIMKRQKISSLKDFFKQYYGSKYKQAQKNFCRSLAAYSLVTYFLQVKDRHNENILLHRDGYIVHIDFGFFLSNSPGQGIQLEKKVPFKLMSSYVDVLGGYNSSLFAEFRRLFQKGFRAAMKHKDELLLLVKMMYSSHGESMPCFKTGIVCIDEMTKRFEPETEDVGLHCQNLINLSLDNWRAKWYDKFQYWFQGIFY